MRALKRWVRYQYAEHKITQRRNSIRDQLVEVLGEKISFHLSGNRGQDSIYIIHCDNVPKAVLRLVNPYRKAKETDTAMPYMPLAANERLSREWDAYQRGAEKGLTPRVLWRCDDAILCEYLPYDNLHNKLLKHPDDFWKFIILASQRLGELHDVGITHMDASLANILTNNSLNHLLFVDFEYGPNKGLDIWQQRAYDYLRLLESSIKFMPLNKNTENKAWLELLLKLTDHETKQADLIPLLPALTRLRANSCLWLAVQQIFAAARI
ncbi:MAG: hypothetical protein DRQ48_01300 [Gammaproteobacteria bacterium]|nr:MAG: hypothetical protein DRQ58_02605 [Gammaproteobacteria bacterium]RKZ72118.1 MAG: hypothetical protein DRQ48_01300 [Gammaproteobacteria bacterium]